MLLSIFVITQIALDIAARHLPRDERAPPAGHRLHATGKARRRAAIVVWRLSRHRRRAYGAGGAGARPRGEPNTDGAAAVSGSCHRGPAHGERARPPSRRPLAPPGGDVTGGSGAAGGAPPPRGARASGS